MSFKSSLVKFAIKMTPNFVVRWVANFILKGIAEISEFSFDIDARTAYVQATLYGETEPIDVWVHDFGIVTDEESHYLTIHEAQSNKPWLNNLLSRIAGKTWKIPAIPQFQDEIELVSEVLEIENTEREIIE
ncbi:MAG: hypothetical protein ACU83V_14770 [Gammaproteobacteria bacterium]